MDKTDVKRFAELMIGVADNFGGKIGDPQVRFDKLKRFSIEQVTAAADHLIENREPGAFPPIPTVKEFFDAIDKIGGTYAGPLESVASIQARTVLQAVKDYGRNRPPVWKDQITRELMRGKWDDVCNHNPDKLSFWTRDFIRDYCASARNIPEMLRIEAKDATPVVGEGDRLRALAESIYEAKEAI